MIKENTFRTKIKDIDFYGWQKNYNNTEMEYPHNSEIWGEGYVEWEFYVEYRSWGVKTISCYATKVEVDYKVSLWQDEGDDIVEEYTIDTSLPILSEWEIENETDDIDFGDSITPHNIQIDFDTKTITINF